MFYQKNFLKLAVSKFTIVLMLVLIFVVDLLLVGGCRRQSKRYIFIDGGAHLGESLLAFKKTNLYSRYPWEIFAIEANPYLIAHIPKAHNIKIINKVIWSKFGKIKFYINTKDDDISSLFKDIAKKGFYTNSDLVEVTVGSIDFGKWLQENFKKEDCTIVSFDIQGAEYEVLDKMLSDGTIQYIDRLYVKFHHNGNEVLRKRAEKLVTEISKLGIIVGNESVDDIIERGDWLDYLGVNGDVPR